MQVLNIGDSICKTFTIPAPTSGFTTGPIFVNITIPSNLSRVSSILSHGEIIQLSNSDVVTWRINSLPPLTEAVATICFAPTAATEESIDDKSGSVTVSSDQAEDDYGNNVTVFDLDYITCGDILGCTEAYHSSGVAYITTDRNGEFMIPHGLGTAPTSVQLTLVGQVPGDGGTGRVLFWLMANTGSANIRGLILGVDGNPLDRVAQTISWSATTR